ncbi:hypothetical protein HMPREF1323_1083, partial [Porphyromonas sp. oral taxon 279 str. F0450]
MLWGISLEFSTHPPYFQSPEGVFFWGKEQPLLLVACLHDGVMIVIKVHGLPIHLSGSFHVGS